MTQHPMIVKAKSLSLFLNDIFKTLHYPSLLSKYVCDGLIETSLRGVDSHGIRLAPHYADAALLGRINTAPRFQIKKTSPATILFDADDTFGIAAAAVAMQKTIALAKSQGVTCAAVYNSSHFAAASIYTLAAARENMIGLSFTNVDSLVLPFGGRKKFLGTNPVCFAAPCAGEEPFCLDMSTSIISWNKIRQHRLKNLALESGWAADKDGNACRNPHEAAALFPVGGYKGYGLALMVEIFSSLLSGMPAAREIVSMFPVTKEKRKLGHFLMAIDIKRFVEVSSFKNRLKNLLTELRAEIPAKGFQKVQVAGDPEKEMFKIRSQKGIPISTEELQDFRRVAKKLNISLTKYPFLN